MTISPDNDKLGRPELERTGASRLLKRGEALSNSVLMVGPRPTHRQLPKKGISRLCRLCLFADTKPTIVLQIAFPEPWHWYGVS